MRIQTRKDLQLLRKLWHFLAGLTFAYAYEFQFNQETMQKWLLLGTVVYGFAELLRFQDPKINRFGVRLFSSFIRRNEVHHVHAGVYFAISCLVAVAVFPKNVAVLSILFLGIGDPIASFFGVCFGRKSLQVCEGKSLIGSFACAVACALVSYVAFQHWGVPFTSSQLVGLAAVCGVIGAVSEALPLPFDDNLNIPILSGFSLWGLFTLASI